MLGEYLACCFFTRAVIRRNRLGPDESMASAL